MQAVSDTSLPLEERMGHLQGRFVELLQGQEQQDRQLADLQTQLDGRSKEVEAGGTVGCVGTCSLPNQTSSDAHVASLDAPTMQHQPLFCACFVAHVVRHAGKTELAAALQKAVSLQKLAQGLSNENKVRDGPHMPQQRQTSSSMLYSTAVDCIP
jgi:hypothetical protein